MQIRIKTFLEKDRFALAGSFKQDESCDSGLVISKKVSYGQCEECLGKTEVQSLDCEVCFSTRGFLIVEAHEMSLSNQLKESKAHFEKKRSENHHLSSSLTVEEKEALGINQSGSFPGILGGGGEDLNEENQSGSGGNTENESNKKSWLGWLLKLLLFLMLVWLLFKGLSFIKVKKKPKITQKIEKETSKKAPKETNSKSVKDELYRPNKKFGQEYSFAPIEVWQNYGNMNYGQLQRNQSLQKYMESHLKSGNLKENRKKMSEKGIFHVCSDFGSFAKDCRDKWFKNRKIRQTFVERIEIIYKNEGDSIYE